MTVREFWHRLTYPIHRARLARDLREEIALHVELRAKQLADGGAPEPVARHGARRRFGNLSGVADAARDVWGWHWLDGAGQDLRYIARQLRRSPGFVVVTVLTVALGIGINTTAFTFYNAIVLKPLAVRDPRHIVRVVQDQRILNPEELPYAAYRALRAMRTLDSVVATSAPQSLSATLPGHDDADARVLSARFTTLNYFSALGVHPAIGRTFDASDERAAVLSHDFWVRALGADRSVIGRRISMHGVALTIVGIVAPSFAGTGLPAAAPDVWVPLDLQTVLVPGTDWRRDGRPHWQLLARVMPDVRLAQVNAELAVVGKAVPDSADAPIPLHAKPATFFQTDSGEMESFQQASAAFMTALALVLAIAVVNLVNLLTARNAAREREVAVRLALGASRARIARQLASESLLLTAAGGAVGLAAAWWSAQRLREWIVRTLMEITGGLVGVFLDLSLDWRIVAYAVVMSCVVGIGVSIWPALRAARGDVNVVLKQGATSTAGGALWRTRNALLATQIAACLVLLSSAGMLLTGVKRARLVETGFDSDHLLVVGIEQTGLTPTERSSLARRVVERLGALPQVRDVAWLQRIPFAGTWTRRVQTRSGSRVLSLNGGSETIFDALGIRLIAGRTFTATEVESNSSVMVISQSLARSEWPGEDPIGKSIPPNQFLSGPDSAKSYVVIGVVQDARTSFLSRPDPPTEYFPHAADGGRGAFIVRTRSSTNGAIHPIAVALAGISPALAARTHVIDMNDGPIALQRLMAQAPAVVALALASLGLVLAAVGVYGLIAQIVTRRTREIGVYMALGARRDHVVAMVVGKTLRPVLWGAGFGAAGALGVSTLLGSMITASDAPDLTFGAGAFNPIVFGAVLGTLALVVIAACYIPARRATKVNPTVALQGE